ncbi:hypothetical protein PSR1_04128 [Anaeromyxobacter sp. PSR-1]|nr:hypothetical protein PSR1_04128 [Anaeromyxobacter sp. PSR-1]
MRRRQRGRRGEALRRLRRERVRRPARHQVAPRAGGIRGPGGGPDAAGEQERGRGEVGSGEVVRRALAQQRRERLQRGRALAERPGRARPREPRLGGEQRAVRHLRPGRHRLARAPRAGERLAAQEGHPIGEVGHLLLEAGEDLQRLLGPRDLEQRQRADVGRLRLGRLRQPRGGVDPAPGVVGGLALRGGALAEERREVGLAERRGRGGRCGGEEAGGERGGEHRSVGQSGTRGRRGQGTVRPPGRAGARRPGAPGGTAGAAGGFPPRPACARAVRSAEKG